ncbi:acyl-CoA dehydrogenase family protein [Polynucleobacter kasalickyi]|uniref:Acyl-CoA dehydrogenase n=1 Tax=Polynucleobacter kasalickyi TaxID=1938817 RepID=A0A1W1YXW1_9BURK|nr:acyl-CoA dehydrogenase family protein [Polynucleobacter kasalickyi]SMC40974.1 acyl-CoA dehydrogenase [Polynucleobacter kasalickyi]
MNFSLSPELLSLQEKVREFIKTEIIPMENDPRQDAHGPHESLKHELIEKAKKIGLLTPHGPKEYGCLALSHVEKAIVFEEAGYSTLGPIALNVHAPDEGNIHLLSEVASPEQKERWLKPLVEGKIRSCFAMTEPAPGAGADPSMLNTTAVLDGNDYVINGTKWFITGAVGASFAIIMAKMEDGSATMFLSDMDVLGIKVVRQMEALDSCFTGGHAVVEFNQLRVPKENVLGAVGKGFRYAQVRLAPARLTHCMRWLGQARRANDIAVEYARNRQAFGQVLGTHEGVGFMLADNDMDLQTARLHIWHTAWLLDQGEKGNFESSRAKTICAEAQWRVVDRCVQILGGQGVTGETIVMRIFKDLRAFRIYDGPSEVHRWSMARKILNLKK